MGEKKDFSEGLRAPELGKFEVLNQPGPHEFLYSFFEDPQVLKLEERLAELDLTLKREEDLRQFGYVSTDLGKLDYFLLDRNPQCVVAAVKVFFSKLPERPFVGEGIPGRPAFWRAVSIFWLEKELERILAHYTKPTFGLDIEEWAEGLKAEVGIDSGLWGTICKGTRAAVKKVSGILGKVEGVETRSPFFSEMTYLIYLMGKDFRREATYEDLVEAFEGELIYKLSLLDANKCLDESFSGYLYESWKSVTPDVQYYFDEPGTDGRIIERDYERSDAQRRQLIHNAVRNAFDKYVEECIKPTRPSAYRG